MKRITLLIFTFLGISGTTLSQTLKEYLQIAVENNSAVKASFNEYLASVENTSQVGALPDPELTIGFFIEPMERFMGKQQADIKLMQMFPWFGMLGTRKDEASKMALAKLEVFEDTKNRLFFQVKKTWYEMYQLEEQVRIAKENLEILKTYEHLALVRFQNTGTGAVPASVQGTSARSAGSGMSTSSSMAGMGTGINTSQRISSSGQPNISSSNASGASMGSVKSGMSDVLRIRIQLKEIESELAFLKDSQVPLRVTFNQLLNRNINEKVIIPDSLELTALSIDNLALLDSITQNNPMLKMLEAEEQAYEVQQRMAKLEGRPMFGAGVNYMPFSPRIEDGMSMGGNDMIMPMVSLSIPIYRKKYNSMAKEAELNKIAVQQRRENTVNQLTVEWSSGLRDLDEAVRKANLYKEQAELARQALDLLMTSYTSDGQSFEEVLAVRQQLLEYQLKLINAIVKQRITISMLEMLAATELN